MSTSFCIRSISVQQPHMGLVEVSLPVGGGEGEGGGEHFARPAAENAQLWLFSGCGFSRNLKGPQREVHRHRQKNQPCTCHCRCRRRARPLSSSAMFVRINQKCQGCLRSLESDLLRNTPKSFGTSRFGLVSCVCVMKCVMCCNDMFFVCMFLCPIVCY